MPESVTEKPSSIFAKRTERSAVAAARFSAIGALAGAVSLAVFTAGGTGAIVGAIDLAATLLELLRSISTRIVLRELRTRCLASRSRRTRTRATGAPSGAVALSTRTALTGVSISAIGLPSSAAAFTFRRSTSTVSGSGWLVR